MEPNPMPKDHAPRSPLVFGGFSSALLHPHAGPVDAVELWIVEVFVDRFQPMADVSNTTTQT
jgi:hypothetical protein